MSASLAITKSEKDSGNVCRLCRVPCDGAQRCINEGNAEMNEVYRITVKYFPAKFLEPCWSKQSAALCLECWHHIIEFYSFQETIFETQKKLQGHEVDVDIKDPAVCGTQQQDDNNNASVNKATEPNMELILKSTSSMEQTTEFEQKQELDINCPNTANKSLNGKRSYEEMNTAFDDQIDISLSDLDDLDIQFISDDEMPQSNDLNKEIPKESLNTKRPSSPCSTSRKDSTTSNGEDINNQEDIPKFIAKYKPKLDCWICGVSKLSFDLLEEHFRLNHRKGQCYIMCCDRKITCENQMLDHIICRHAEKSNLRCKICKNIFTSTSALKRHEDRKHRFNCPECPVNFNTREQLENHYNAHFVCKLCNKGFTTTEGLKSHTQSVHIASNIIVNTNHITVFKCKECGKRMDTKTLYDHHQRVVHNNGCTYKCNLCGEVFRKSLDFRDHLNYHTADNYYQCPHCPQRFQYWSYLESHMVGFHTGKCTQKHMQQLRVAEEAYVRIQIDQTDIKSKVSLNTNSNVMAARASETK